MGRALMRRQVLPIGSDILCAHLLIKCYASWPLVSDILHDRRIRRLASAHQDMSTG